jgi:hypothetical protein
MANLTIFLFLWGALFYSARGQGAWLPAGADESYPRIMLKNAQRAAVQASLSDTIIRAVYQGLYQNAASAPPSDNTNTSNQRARATIAQNAAFVYYLDRKYDAGWNPIPLSAAEKDAFLTKCLGLLENINTTVEQITIFQPDAYTNWQWRSKMIIHFMCAYDLLKGAGVPDPLLQNARNKLIEYARNLYREANRSVLGLTFFDVVKNNHTLMTTCALGVAAVVLNDHASGDPNAQPANWLQCALWHTDNVLWRDPSRNSEPDTIAGYAEGTYYAKYWLINGLPFFRGMGHFAPDIYITATYKGNSRSIRNPWYDPAYENIYEWIARTRLPDGKMPPLEDSYWNSPFLELALTGKPELHWKIYNGIIGSAAHYNATLNDVFDLRAHYVAANTPLQTQENRKLFQALPVSGNLVFRSSWGPEAIYMHVNGQNGLMRQSAGGHGQADASSFLCYAYGQHLALDAGYLSYAQRNKVMNADNHNMILVNGTCGPVAGTPGVTGDADAYTEKALDTPRLDYGKVTTAYCNTQIARHFLFIDNRYFLQSDFISSPSAESFTWQLHGNGLENGNASSGIFLRDFANSQATWQKQGVSLLAHITAQNQLTQIDTTSKPHELDYNNPINHTVLLATKTGEKNTLFMAGLYPYKNQTPPLITNLNGLPAGLTGIQTINNGKKEQFYAQLSPNDRSLPPALTSLGDTAFLNGQLTFISYSLEGQFLQAFVQNGSRLRVGSQKWMQSQKNLDMALQKLTDSTYYAYASQKDTLHFFIPQPVRLVEGANILAWNYDCLEQTLSVTLNGGGAFTIFIGSPSLSASPPVLTEICAGLPLILEAPVSTGITYIWESPLGQRLEGNVLNIPQASAEQNGNWKLRALQNQCVIAEFNVSISIKPSPRLSDLPSAISLCLGADLTLSAFGETGTHYLWRAPDGFEATGFALRRENLPLAAAGIWELRAQKGDCQVVQNFTLTLNGLGASGLNVIHNAPLCQNETLSLSAPLVAGAAYLWQGPGNFTATTPELSFTAEPNAHSGQWRLLIRLEACTLLQTAVEIRVKPLPLASNPPPRLVLCPGQALQINTGAQSQTQYYWQGPHGFSLTAPALILSSVTSAASGNWFLRAEKEGCQREETFMLEVRALPPAPTVAYNTPLCSGQELRLGATSIANARYTWEGPGGLMSDTPTASYIRSTPQEETWRLLVTLEHCVLLDTTFTIGVRPTPLPSPLDPELRLCQGASLSLAALGEELTDYTWFSPALETLSGATLRLENITPAAAGIWKLQSERAGCLTEQTFQLTIESAPEPPQVFSNAPVCQGAVLQFTSQTLSGAVYIWKGPAGITADLPNLSLLAGLEHNGNWSLTVLHNQCTLLTRNFPIEVYPLPLPSALAPRLTLCLQSALHLPSAQEVGTIYTWQGPGNFVSTEPILAILAIKEDNAGMWRLKANKNGCQREQTFEVEVVRLPRPPQLTAPAVLCQGEALALGLSPLPEAIYQWRGPNGFESNQAALNLVASPSLHSGAWTAQVTYQGCIVFDTLFTLSVSPLPQASALESSYSLCPGARWKLQTAQESGAGYIFTGPNGFTYQGNVLEIPTVNAANSGVYQLKTEKNGCAIRQTFSLEVKNAPQPPTFTAPSWVCFGAPFRLIAELLPGVLYQWKAPDGTLYPSPHVEIAQAETRLQGAWELLTRYQECTLATYNIPIMVRQKPQPSLLELAYTTCQGKTLSITAASETDVFYQWEGPDYFTFSGPALVLENILPQASGIWRLRAEKEGCSREQTFTVAVESPPLWPTLPAFQTICQGQDWELGFPPLPGVTYQWQGPNGFSASSSLISIPNISPSAAGVYSLRMQSAHCQAALQTTTLSVKRVSARFAGQDTVICSGENWRLTFEVEGSGPWELEVLPLGKITLGAEGQTGPIFLFYPLQSVQNATYTLVSVRDKNGCAAAASGSRKVTVAQPPANLSIEGKAALCQGDNLAFRAMPNQVGVTYLWQGPGNFNASGATMNRNGLQMEDAGVYSLMAVIGSCSARIATRLVTIFPNPEVTIQSAPPAALCLPTQPTLGLRLSGAAPWQFSYIENGQAKGPFSLSGLAVQLPLRTEAGSYTLSDFQLVDSRGCLAQISIAPINYTLYPPMLLTVESVAAASCSNSGGEATLRATGGPGAAYEYELQPMGISSATGRFTDLGAYTYTAIARSGACQAQAMFIVAANAPPYGLTISPVNGLAFAQWQEVIGSRGYKIRYREVGGNGFYQEVSPIQTNSVSLRGLTPGKTYEIQVQALCADGTPTAWSSAQTYTSPNTCPLVSALQITPFSPTGANVQWPMVPVGAVCYALSFGKIDTDPNLWQQVMIPYSHNAYLLSGLEPGQRYGARIRTNCQLCSSVSGVFSPWSEVSVFTTPSRQGLATAGTALRLWPNPLRGGFWLSWGGQEVIGLSITLFDAQGKAAFRAQESDFEAAAGATEIWIPLSDLLVPGLYTAQISLHGKFRFTEKIIIAP